MIDNDKYIEGKKIPKFFYCFATGRATDSKIIKITTKEYYTKQELYKKIENMYTREELEEAVHNAFCDGFSHRDKAPLPIDDYVDYTNMEK